MNQSWELFLGLFKGGNRDTLSINTPLHCMLRKPIARILDLEITLHNFLMTDEKTDATM